MPENTQVFIASPCHESWDNMQAGGDGRFCGSCQKTVVDFTMMTDQEVLNWFSRSKPTDSVCGRLHSEQMHRDLIPVAYPKKNRWAIWWQFLVAGVLVSSKASAQGKVSVTSPTIQTIPGHTPPVIRVPVPDKVLPIRTKLDEPVMFTAGMVSIRRVYSAPITINVIDSASGNPVGWASVRIGGQGFVTDPNGTLSIQDELLAKAREIEVTAVGYEKKTFGITDAMRKGAMPQVRMTLAPMMMGELVVVRRKHRKPAPDILKDTLYRMKDTLCGVLKSPVTIYPNPAYRGASLTVSLYKVVAGDYTIQLFSNAGTLAETMRIEAVNGARTELLQLPESLAAGMYFIKVTNTVNGKVYTQKLSVL